MCQREARARRGAAAGGKRTEDGLAFADLRAYLEALEGAGELQRVATEVDWNLEVGAVSRRALDLYGPALLFERLTRYAPGSARILTNIFGRSPGHPQARFAMAMELPPDTPTMDVIAEFGRRSHCRIPPRRVESAPCKEHVLHGADVDLLRFPAPVVHGGDGGRFLGTWHVNVTRDPDSGLVNWGMYRHQVHDARTLGFWTAPVQHAAATYLQKYEPRGEPMPMAVAIGTEPITSAIAGSPVPTGVSEADVAGGIRGQAVDVVPCETMDLEVPASAEIVLEGEVPPRERMTEGPFGEFTGYMAPDRVPRPVFRVKCITYRSNPILTVSNIGKPWEEESVLGSVAWSALLAEDLRARGFEFKSLYVPPPLQAVIVAVKHLYPGYGHALASAIWSSKLGFYRPYIFFVGEDVDVTDMEDVFWCLTTRLHPGRGIHVQQNTPALTLWPWLTPEERQARRGTKVYFDATFPAEWREDELPVIIDFTHGWPADVQQRVLDRWDEYGIGNRRG
jgi:phenylphosphate carboxylase alpha subunit